MTTYHYLYKTTNLKNNKIYIGVHSTDNLEDGYIGSGKFLKQSILKYGKEYFKCEILEFFESRELAYKREAELVNEDFIKSSTNYNCAPGGGGTAIGESHPCFGKRWKLTEETKLKQSLSKTGDKNPMFGGLSEEHKTTLSTAMKTSAKRGKEHPNYGVAWSDEEKEKRRQWSKEAYANRPNLKCPHCDKEMKPNLYARYHGDKCKLRLV